MTSNSEYQDEVAKYDAIFNTDETAVLSLKHGGITTEVRFDRYVFDRPEYFFRVYGPEGPIIEPILHGGHLAGGTDDEVNLPKMMASLASFVSAWAEAHDEDSENWTLFDNDHRHTLDWDEWSFTIHDYLGETE